MNNLNSIIIEGNIVYEPVLKEINKDTSVCTFKIANDRFYKKDNKIEKDTGFFDVEAWGKLAEIVGNHGHKGRGVRITGYLKQDKWMGNDDKPRSKIIIYALNVELRKDENREEVTEEVTEEPNEEINGNDGD